MKQNDFILISTPLFGPGTYCNQTDPFPVSAFGTIYDLVLVRCRYNHFFLILRYKGSYFAW
jgi:hypothetical protein